MPASRGILKPRYASWPRSSAFPAWPSACSTRSRSIYAYHGVTNVENPLPVDHSTLFQFGSTGKTFTSVAMLRLGRDGRVDLDAPVRTYVPELRLTDEEPRQR